MNVEIMIYIYLFVCSCMIVFNIVTAFVLKKREQTMVRVSKNFDTKVQLQLKNIRYGVHCDDEHKKYLCRKLKHIGNMTAFDKMLESVYINEPDAVMQYLSELDSVFIALCGHYSGKDRIEAAYFPYIIKKYRLIAFRAYPSIIEMLFGLLDEPSIYCRENAMQALYTTGDSDYVIKALKKIDKSDLFYHGKLLSDGLLNFSRSDGELADKIISQFESFSVDMQVNLLNFIRFSSGNYREFAYKLLCDEKRNDEIRYCAIRYLGKYPFDNAYEKLCSLSENDNSEKWQYSAIASTALASYPKPETVDILKNNLYSRNWYIRFNSADSLERLGVTYTELADIMDGNDRYAAEILRYKLQKEERGVVQV